MDFIGQLKRHRNEGGKIKADLPLQENGGDNSRKQATINCAKIFQLRRIHLNILGVTGVTSGKFHTGDSQRVRGTVQNFVARAT